MAVSKPLPGQQIDRSAPYAGSLLGAWAFNEGGGSRVNDAAGVRSAAAGSASAMVWSGDGGVFNGSSSGVNVSGANPGLLKTSKFSGFARFKTSSATFQALIGAWELGTSPGWIFRVENDGKLIFLLVDVSGTNFFFVKTSLVVGDGKVHNAAFTYDGSNTAAGIKIYVDGVQVATTTTTGGTADPGTFTNFNIYLGRNGGWVVYWFNGVISGAGLWGTTLDPGFARAVTSNPWQLWPDDQIVFAPATGINITPDPATLTLTGYAPTVTAPAAVTPTPASLTLTGYAPTVTAPASITPTPATLTLTGYPPTVTTSAATNDSEWIITARRRGRR